MFLILMIFSHCNRTPCYIMCFGKSEIRFWYVFFATNRLFWALYNPWICTCTYIGKRQRKAIAQWKWGIPPYITLLFFSLICLFVSVPFYVCVYPILAEDVGIICPMGVHWQWLFDKKKRLGIGFLDIANFENLVFMTFVLLLLCFYLFLFVSQIVTE